jgi:hypothetical protein
MPRGPIVRGAKDLALAGAKADLLGVVPINRHAERRALGADTVVDTLPGRTQIR